MSNAFPIQDLFSYGEISPRLRGQVGSDKYQNGVAYLENFEVTPQGNIEMRSGSEHIAIIDNTDGVLKTFIRQLDKDVVVVITDNSILLYDRGGLLRVPGTGSGGLPINFFDESYILSGSEEGWYFADSDIGPDLAISNEQGIGVQVQFKFPYPDSSAYVTATIDSPEIELRDGTAEHRFGSTLAITSYSGGHNYNVMVEHKVLFFDSAAGDWTGNPRWVKTANQECYDGKQSYSLHHDAGKLNLLCHMNLLPDTITKVKFQWILVGRTLETGGYHFVTAVINDIITYDDITEDIPINLPYPYAWSGHTHEIQTCQDTGSNQMFFTCPTAPPKVLEYDEKLESWEFRELDITLDGKTEPPWPKSCAIHDSRLWLGNGGEILSGALWASRVNNYEDFDLVPIVPDTITDEDPMYFKLSSGGAIQWLHSSKELVIGLDKGISIGTSSGAIITPTDFAFPQHQAIGTAPIQPIEVNRDIIGFSTNKRRMQAVFDGGDRAGGYESADINSNSSHLMLKGVMDVAYLHNPDYKIVSLLNDGTAATTTFYEQGKINGHYRGKLAGTLKIVSITSSEESSGSALWGLVADIDKPGSMSLEVRNDSTDSRYMLDSHALKQCQPGDEITGLDWLNYRTVSIVNVGDTLTVLEDQHISGDGTITAPDWLQENSTLLIGIPYTARCTLLPIEGSNPAGTAQTQRRSWSDLRLRMYDSAIPMVNGVRPPLRYPEQNLNTSPLPVTGDVKYDLMGWGEGILDIVQEKPLPTNITAVFGKITGNSL